MKSRKIVFTFEVESTEKIDVLRNVIKTQVANPPLTRVLQIQSNVIKPEPKKGTPKWR